MGLPQLKPAQTERPAPKPQRPSDEIVAFVEEVLDRETEGLLQIYGQDKRSEQRYRIALPVVAVPIDANLQPVGASFVTVTRNISTRGIAVLSSKAMRARFMAVKLTLSNGKELQAAIEILRCKPFGPFFEVGGKFVAKIYGRPNLGFNVDEAEPDTAEPTAGRVGDCAFSADPAVDHSSGDSESTQD